MLSSIEIQHLVTKMDDSKKKHSSLKRSNFPEYCKRVANDVPQLSKYYDSIFYSNIHDELEKDKFKIMMKCMKLREQGKIEQSDKVWSEYVNKEYVPQNLLDKIKDSSQNS